jgi:hypothetical protein
MKNLELKCFRANRHYGQTCYPSQSQMIASSLSLDLKISKSIATVLLSLPLIREV